MFACLFVCLFVCLLATLRKKGWTDFHEIQNSKLVQAMAWRREDTKPLTGSVVIEVNDAHMHLSGSFSWLLQRTGQMCRYNAEKNGTVGQILNLIYLHQYFSYRINQKLKILEMLMAISLIYSTSGKKFSRPQNGGHFENFEILKTSSFWHQIWKDRPQSCQKIFFIVMT